jgi:L-ascorbate metabolism protein UlaG (beta-lactamase superfamily)
MPSPRRNAVAPPTQPIGSAAFAPSTSTTLWWLGGAGFLINARGTLVMIDPAISLEPGSADRSEFGLRLLVPHPIEAHQVPRLDLVLISHTDPDHLAPITAPALFRTGATFVGPEPVVARLREWGLPDDRLRVVKSGDRIQLGAVDIAPTHAKHDWQLQDPARYGPPFGPDDCLGFLVRTPDGTIWHPGDTTLLDEHLAQTGVDVLLLDISRDVYHLGPPNAARLANVLGARTIIPHHYGCYDDPDFAAVNGDPAEVAELIEDASRRLRILAPGEPYRVTSNE